MGRGMRRHGANMAPPSAAALALARNSGESCRSLNSSVPSATGCAAMAGACGESTAAAAGGRRRVVGSGSEWRRFTCECGTDWTRSHLYTGSHGWLWVNSGLWGAACGWRSDPAT